VTFLKGGGGALKRESHYELKIEGIIFEESLFGETFHFSVGLHL